MTIFKFKVKCEDKKGKKKWWFYCYIEQIWFNLSKSKVAGFYDYSFGQQIRLYTFISKILADTWIFIASEWCWSLLVVVAVDINRTCLQSLYKFKSSINVGSHDTSSKTIGKGVGSSNYVLFITPLEYTHDRAKNLFSCDFHMILNICEDCRFNEVPFFT